MSPHRILLLLFPILLALFGDPARAQQGAAKGEWRFYGGDAGSTKYSPLDQINASNVKQLEIAWRWKAENFGPRPDYNWEVTPLMVGGVLYFTAGSRRDAVAVDGATGETLWMYRLDEGERGDRAVRTQNRGLGLLDRWQERQPHSSDLAGLSVGRARCQVRAFPFPVSATKASLN